MPKLIRHAALSRAETFAGKVTENPPGSNRGPLIDKWNMDAIGQVAVYWCASFVHGMFKLAGFFLPGGASVWAIKEAGRKSGWIVKRPRKGDIACFELHGAFAYDDHVGIVRRVLALRWSGDTFTGWVETVEGNTSAQNDPSGSQSNGGGVFVRRRWIRNTPAVFVRVPGRVQWPSV